MRTVYQFFFFVLLASIVFVFRPLITEAAEPLGCTCATKIEGGNICTANKSQTFALGETVVFKDLAKDLLKTQCPAGSSADTSSLNAFPPMLISEESCSDLKFSGVFNGTNYVLTYNISCTLLSAEQPKAPAKGAQKPSIELENPLGETSITVLIGKVMKAALGIIGAVTLFVFVYGGFLWLISAGKSEQVEKGSKAMLYAAIGLCIIFASYAILNTILTGLGGA